jgi:hypothetical protein
VNKERIQKHGDPWVVQSLQDHSGWKVLERVLQDRILEETEFIITNSIVDEKSAAKHNLAVGKIEALREVLSYPSMGLKR